MQWQPEPLWQDQDAFVLGGGLSLKNMRFDFSILENERVIGCNDAYKLGPAICNICVFGDQKWFDFHREPLSEYAAAGGLVVTNVTAMYETRIPWVMTMRRRLKGVHHDALGWNLNTGSVAMNLGLILGAKTIYLLGFDRWHKKGQGNWHVNTLDTPTDKIYSDMNYAETYAAKDLKNKFPDRQIVNVTDSSKLDVWPKVPVAEFWAARRPERSYQCNTQMRLQPS